MYGFIKVLQFEHTVVVSWLFAFIWKTDLYE